MSLRHGVPKNPPLGVHPQTSSKIPYTLPSSVSSNSFICHSYENCRGVYPFFPFWHCQSQVTNHESPFLPPLSFQSLTNCPRFATHSEPLSFQPITNCSICKSFVLIMIQQYPGWVGTSLLRPSRKTLSPLIPDPVSSSFVPRIRRRRVRGFFGSSSALNCELLAVGLWANSFRINTCEPLVTVDSKRLTQTLNPLDATLTKKRGEGVCFDFSTREPINLPTCKPVLICSGAQHAIEMGRKTFTQGRNPQGGDDSGEYVHGVMRAQDQDGGHLKEDEQDSSGREPLSVQAG